MRKVMTLSLGLALLVTVAFGQATVSIVSTSAENGQAAVPVAINLDNASAVGGLQFSIKDVPNQLSVLGVQPAGRTAAEPYQDVGVDQTPGTGDFGEGDGQYTPGEPYTDLNDNGEWDAAFSVQFTSRDTSVSILVFDNAGRSIPAGNAPIVQVIFGVPNTVSDAIINLRFHEIPNAEIPWGLVISDPDGNAVDGIWENGQLTIGGVQVRLPEDLTAHSGLTATYEISMTNAEPVKGFQFTIQDNPDYLTVSSVSGLGRAADFTVETNEVNGGSMVIGIDTDGGEIAAGDGAIVSITFNVSSAAGEDESVALTFTDLVVAASGGVALPANANSATVTILTDISPDELTGVPTDFALKQNYPNPFNPTTTIGFEVPEHSNVHLGIYNVLGQEVRSLVRGNYTPGRYQVVWDATDNHGSRVVSGVYFYRMTTSSGFTSTQKLVLLK
ncbi:MAG: T9SS type A sorting domain-containing protein [Lentisphaeria bacterium]|nr:T9SS type A sorting domain-containing protein [Candidatus Neomarinimicrobiota bacterium]MCF7841410.1 T9SS type A sorting domain-containing protein [Lentisphaeria bacterium]